MSSRTGKLFPAIISLILSALFLDFNAEGKDNYPVTDTVTSMKTAGIIISKNGLILRSTPSSKASKIIQMSQGTVIIIHNQNGPVETLHGITASWFKISCAGKEGWAFGGFIKQLKHELLSAYKTGDVELFLYKNNEFEMQINMCSGLAFIYGNLKKDKNIIKCRVTEIKGSGFMGDDITEFNFIIIDEKSVEYDGKPIGCAPFKGNRLIKI